MRVLWLAVADARGHLMRAHLCRIALAARGVDVDIVTTSDDGVAFARAMGSPASVGFDTWRVAMDAGQCLDRAVTHGRALRYVFDPRRMLADLLALRGLEYDLFVNDFHPLLLCDRAFGGSTPVVHVHGEHLWNHVARPFQDTALAPLDRLWRPLLSRLRDRGDAVLVHRPTAAARLDRRGDTYVLPPITPSPSRSRAQVRADLGLGANELLATCYLNPYFRDPRLAEQVERCCDGVGAHLYGVAEGFTSRPRWRAFDPNWVDKVAAADVLIAPPGMGSIGLHRTVGTPLLMLLTDQPEQRANAGALACHEHAIAVEFRHDQPIPAAAVRQLLAGRRPARPVAVTELWADAIEAVGTRCARDRRVPTSRNAA